MTAVLVLLGLSVLRIVVLVLGAAMVVHHVRECPACGRDTVAVQRRWLEIAGDRYEWRWCPVCGWEGVARRDRATNARPP